MNFETLWNEIIEYARLGENELRRVGRSCFEGEIPNVICKEEIDYLDASAEQFGANSRRLVKAFSIEIDSNILGYRGTLLLDINLSDLTVTLLGEMGSRNNHSEEKRISFLDMSSETFWFTNQFCDRDFLFHDYMEPFEDPFMEEFSSNRWRDLRFAAQYMDGENLYGAKQHTFCSVSREGITTEWAQESDGDTPQLTVLGDFLYERHGDAYYDDTWNFYYKRNEPVLAFSVSVKDIEKEYNHLDLYLTAADA